MDLGTDERVPTYRELVAMPTWRRWVVAVGGSRIPIAMAPLAFVYVGEAAVGSYGLGALMAGVYSVAEALSAPMSGRLLGRSADMRRGLGLMLFGGAAMMVALAVAAWLSAPAALMVLLAAACGAVPAAAQGGLRAMLHKLVPARLSEKAFALDSTLLEVQWALAPLIVAGCVAAGVPTLTALAMALAASIAGVMVLLLPVLEEPAEHRPGTEAARPASAADEDDLPPAWRAPQASGAYVTSFLLGYAEGTVVIALPPLLSLVGAPPSSAATILVGMSLSSAAGGWVYGWLTPRLGEPTSVRAALFLALLGLLIIPVGLADDLWLAAVFVVLAGAVIAPINALRSLQLSRLLPERQHAEGFSVLYGLNVLGTGASGLLLALLLQVADERFPMVLAGAATAVAGGVSALVARRSRRR